MTQTPEEAAREAFEKQCKHNLRLNAEGGYYFNNAQHEFIGWNAALAYAAKECELLREENARWRKSHASESFNPDWCAASASLTEHLKANRILRDENAALKAKQPVPDDLVERVARGIREEIECDNIDHRFEWDDFMRYAKTALAAINGGKHE